MKYTVIKSDKQHREYCNKLENLVFSEQSDEYRDEIELLTLLIEDWEARQFVDHEMDPVELVKSLMEEHDLTQTDLAEIAGIGKSYMSEILNYKKQMSKRVIRNIARHFKIRQSALNKKVEYLPTD